METNWNYFYIGLAIAFLPALLKGVLFILIFLWLAIIEPLYSYYYKNIYLNGLKKLIFLEILFFDIGLNKKERQEVYIKTIQLNEKTKIGKIDTIDENILEDTTFLKKYLNKYPIEYFLIPERLRKNKELFLCNPKITEYEKNIEVLSEELKNDKEIALQILKNRAYFYGRLGEKTLNDKELSFIALEKYPSLISKLSKELQQDFSIAHFAVQKDFEVYGVLSDSMKDNNTIIKTVLEKSKVSTQKIEKILKGLPKRLQQFVNLKDFECSIEAILLYLEMEEKEKTVIPKRKISKI